jgi:hypothetical protein
MPNIFLKRTPFNVKTDAFNIRVAPLLFANTDIQFILNPHAAASYCTSYMTKIGNFINSKLHSIIEKYF